MRAAILRFKPGMEIWYETKKNVLPGVVGVVNDPSGRPHEGVTLMNGVQLNEDSIVYPKSGMYEHNPPVHSKKRPKYRDDTWDLIDRENRRKLEIRNNGILSVAELYEKMNEETADDIKDRNLMKRPDKQQRRRDRSENRPRKLAFRNPVDAEGKRYCQFVMNDGLPCGKVIESSNHNTKYCNRHLCTHAHVGNVLSLRKLAVKADKDPIAETANRVVTHRDPKQRDHLVENVCRKCSSNFFAERPLKYCNDCVKLTNHYKYKLSKRTTALANES